MEQINVWTSRIAYEARECHVRVIIMAQDREHHFKEYFLKNCNNMLNLFNIHNAYICYYCEEFKGFEDEQYTRWTNE